MQGRLVCSEPGCTNVQTENNGATFRRAEDSSLAICGSCRQRRMLAADRAKGIQKPKPKVKTQEVLAEKERPVQ